MRMVDTTPWGCRVCDSAIRKIPVFAEHDQVAVLYLRISDFQASNRDSIGAACKTAILWEMI